MTSRTSGRRKFFWAAAAVLILALGAVAGMALSGGSSTGRQMDLGEKYLAEGKYEKAVEAFSKVIEVDPDIKRAYQGLSEAYAALGRRQDAVDMLNAALARFDGDEALQTALDALTPEPVTEPPVMPGPGENRDREPAFGETDGSAAGFADQTLFYVESGSAYVPEAVYYPCIALHPDGSFEMIVNYFEGMSHLSGTYRIQEDTYVFTVTGGPWPPNESSFSMTLSEDALRFDSGSRIGATEPGSLFVYSEEEPESYQWLEKEWGRDG